MKGFIKNEEILEEDYRKDDLLDFSNIIKSFKGMLKEINTNSMIGIIGRFGIGKSTMLYQLYKDRDESDQDKWIHFDAWKYPERKDLWEGFVLEVTRQIDKKLFNEVKKIIDGEKNRSIINTIKIIFSGINFVVTGVSAMGKILADLFKTSPVKRVFEFQDILKGVFNSKVNGDIFIIIEDIDRSGDRGIFFLETLKYFIKESSFNNKVIIIVPVGEEKRFEKGIEDAYDKIFDYDFYFRPENIDFIKFIKKIFNDDLLSDNNFSQHINFFFKRLMRDDLTIRELKGILRLANIEYRKLSKEQKKKVDIRIWIAFAYIYKYYNIKIKEILYQTNGRLVLRGIWIKNFLVMVGRNAVEMSDGIDDVRLFIVDDYDKIIPTYYNDPFGVNESGYYLSNIYLEYFK